MDEIKLVIGWKTGAILLFLDLLAWIYALIVFIMLPKWKIQRSSSGLVVIGVIFTVIGYGCLIGWETILSGWVSVLVITACFIATGIPMIIGYKFKIDYDDNRDKEQARAIAQAALEVALKKVKSNGEVEHD